MITLYYYDIKYTAFPTLCMHFLSVFNINFLLTFVLLWALGAIIGGCIVGGVLLLIIIIIVYKI